MWRYFLLNLRWRSLKDIRTDICVTDKIAVIIVRHVACCLEQDMSLIYPVTSLIHTVVHRILKKKKNFIKMSKMATNIQTRKEMLLTSEKQTCSKHLLLIIKTDKDDLWEKSADLMGAIMSLEEYNAVGEWGPSVKHKAVKASVGEMEKKKGGWVMFAPPLWIRRMKRGKARWARLDLGYLCGLTWISGSVGDINQLSVEWKEKGRRGAPDGSARLQSIGCLIKDRLLWCHTSGRGRVRVCWRHRDRRLPEGGFVFAVNYDAS